MARPIRIEYRGAQYHIMARGNGRQKIFYTPRDYELFLKTLGEALERYDLRLLAYVLMPNHYHLYLETPQGNLSQAMGWFQTTFTIRYNRCKNRVGHLFQGRYKAHLVEDDHYGMDLICYIHLNPIHRRRKGRLEQVGSWEQLQGFEWSSHLCYTGSQNTNKVPLNYDCLRFWGQGKAAGMRGYLKYMRQLVLKAETPDPLSEVREGLLIGSENFVEKMIEMISGKSGVEESRVETRWEQEDREQLVRSVVAGCEDQKLKIWALLRFGGVSQVQLAREWGYRDGSGVHYVARRLEKLAESDHALEKQMSVIRRKLSIVKR